MPRPEPSQVAGGVKKPVAKQGGEQQQQQQQQQQQLAPDSAALFDLLNSGYGHEYQAQAAAVASQQFQHPNFGFNLNFPSAGFLPVSPPGLPHMMPGFHPGGYPPPHLLPRCSSSSVLSVQQLSRSERPSSTISTSTALI